MAIAMLSGNMGIVVIAILSGNMGIAAIAILSGNTGIVRERLREAWFHRLKQCRCVVCVTNGFSYRETIHERG